MSQGSKIEWTDASWVTVTGCTRVSEGCRNCYAERLTATRLAHQPKYAGLAVLNASGQPRWSNQVRCHHEALDEPLRWRAGRRVFVNSMSDTFHPDVPLEFVDRLFAVMALCPQHRFQILTKRPERMAEYLGPGQFRDVHVGDAANAIRPGSVNPGMMAWPLANVWLGTSVENQEAADERIPALLRCPAAVTFLSLEPLLGAIDLTRVPNTSPPMPGCPSGAPSRRVDWVIVGGESGGSKESPPRPFDLAWARSIRDQCRAAGVAFFLKQLGARPFEYAEIAGARATVLTHDRKGGRIEDFPADLRIREMPTVRA